MVLDWIRYGYSIPFNTEVTQTHVPLNTLEQSEVADMKIAIQKLLDLGAISECHKVKNQYISKVFLAPKPNGGKRFILNLKGLNKFIAPCHFKMEDYRTASKLIPQNGFLATIDLTEAYLLIPIGMNDRKYLRFQFNNHIYEFNSMPYGLSVAPRVFTKIMKQVISNLRSRGFKSVIYLDDILCIGDTYQECLDNVKETLKLLQCLGFVINYDKSSLHPDQTCKFLGFEFNTQNLTIALPENKRNKIAQLLGKFLKLPKCTIREYSQLIGVLVSACPAVKYGWVYTKTLERQKYLELLKNNENFEAKIKPSRAILEDLNWWLNKVSTSNNCMRFPSFQLEIYSDASNSGWGAVCGKNKANGTWKSSERDSHINYLELLAVYLGLKSFAKNMTDCAILLRVDNTTAISYINRMGGIQFPHLNDLARTIWQWCEERNILIFASYINTTENIADPESRKIVNPDTEWELSNRAFESILHRFGKPTIDLFASRSNAKCQNFVSWKPDPDAIAVDAFTINWSENYFYAFPPFSLILKCLRKIVDDQAKGILVFPYWPSQPWFPLLQSLISSEIMFLNPNKNLLHSHYRDCHPLHRGLTLGVAKLCTKTNY
ncbi:uncharacterized protein LOC125229783 [Leguminivora glycinivorella]|uniref:uncharacterized protein LOC125229783 n=1 Tax=Leguminivora glycinivorella TaxID=1035111 RepID=UPI00200F24FD|nr:uncharacterized protein LOC125229783 [Leguminivora glycinivorella]